jgi:hypothetical protein
MKRLNKLGYDNLVGARRCLAGVILLCCLLLSVSCAAPRLAEKPSHRGIALDEALAQYRQISSINTVLGLEYEKNDTVMSGDASLSVSPDKLSLRIYYLGFLQGEIYEENGAIRSKPKLDKNKSSLLVEGLKSSLFWWNIKDYKEFETADSYELRNESRKVVINKETLLPVEQIIELENGDKLTITYDVPSHILACEGQEATDTSPAGWYQSRIRLQLKNYVVRVNVKSYSVTR